MSVPIEVARDIARAGTDYDWLVMRMYRYPEPFKVDIKPRSSSAEILVKEAIMGVDR